MCIRDRAKGIGPVGQINVIQVQTGGQLPPYPPLEPPMEKGAKSLPFALFWRASQKTVVPVVPKDLNPVPIVVFNRHRVNNRVFGFGAIIRDDLSRNGAQWRPRANASTNGDEPKVKRRSILSPGRTAATKTDASMPDFVAHRCRLTSLVAGRGH